MARYTGPKWKLNRRANFSLDDKEKWKKRPTTPGQHGKGQRRNLTAYATQFSEKQKIKRIYGLLEKQFRRFFEMASVAEGNTGLRLLQLLELRLDNVVYRMGLARTRAGARQMVTHGHVKVNGKKVDLPSYIVQVGDEIRLKDKMAETANYKVLAEENKSKEVVKWIEKLTNGGVVKSEPTREMIDQAISEQLVVEYYSR